MIKIGMIGSDSSHSADIGKIIADDFDDVAIIALYGDNMEENELVAKVGNIPYIAKSFDELLQVDVDGIMIVNRDGKLHLKYAKPYIERGIPTWIDKPFTVSIEDTVDLLFTAQKKKTLITGGSSIKHARQIDELKKNAEKAGEILSGYCSFPIQLNSQYSGIHFYSHHLIEGMISIFGWEVKSICSHIINDKLTAIAKYNDFNVIMNYAVNYDGQHIGVYGSKQNFFVKIDLQDAMKMQVQEFIKMIRTGKQPYTYEYFSQAVKISNALEQSIKENREIYL